jgi:hypothetical protein
MGNVAISSRIAVVEAVRATAREGFIDHFEEAVKVVLMPSKNSELDEPSADKSKKPKDKKDKPSKPIVSIHCREPRDTAKIIKSFYLKYPQYRWFTFRDMKNISQTDFSKFLKESFVSVWVDRESGFGTFPIESMISNTPVIGVVPNLKPDWMNENNGIWTYSFNEIIDVLANFAQNWLEDNINEELYTKMSETGEKYQNKESFDNKIESLFVDYFNVRKEMFSQQLEKLKITDEK